MGPAGSQLLMWFAAWLTPLRCWRDGKIQWPQATTEVGKMPPPSRAFLLSLSSGAQWAQALVFQFLMLAAWHHSEASGRPTCGIRWVRLGEVGLAWPCPFDKRSYRSGDSAL